MSSSPPDHCGYTWPEDYEIEDRPFPIHDPRSQPSCCCRKTVTDDHDRCVWHADPNGVVKSAKALRRARAPPETRQQNTPYAELLDGANLSGVELGKAISFENVALRDSHLTGATLNSANLSDATLSGADLIDAYLRGATLSGADLSGADLSDATLTDADLSDATIGDADFSYAYLRGADFSEATLVNTDFSNAALRDADFSDADLRRADFSDADLRRADLSGAILWDSNLSDADLRRANLSGADILDADLTDADLRIADFSDAALRGADFSDAALRGANIVAVSVNGETTCTRLYEGYGDGGFIVRLPFSIRLRRIVTDSGFNKRDWDATALAYHDLKEVFSDHGLVGKARKKHVQERRARSLEAKAEGGWFARRYFGSLPSRIFTGYGVQVSYLVFWMVALFLVSTVVYVSVRVNDTYIGNIAYSVLAFTVAPPRIPTPVSFVVGTQIIMMIETFFGTLSIVLLGYILGNRERF